MTSKLIILFIMASLFDLGSTIAVGQWSYEENPLARFFWQHYGLSGLVFIKALMTYIFIRLSLLLREWLAITALSVATIMNVLVGLTNLGLIPYWVLSFINY